VGVVEPCFLKFGRVGLAAAAMGSGIAVKIDYIIKLTRYMQDG
jgi:hypothetical protein